MSREEKLQQVNAALRGNVWQGCNVKFLRTALPARSRRLESAAPLCSCLYHCQAELIRCQAASHRRTFLCTARPVNIMRPRSALMSLSWTSVPAERSRVSCTLRSRSRASAYIIGQAG